jgi:hypothetical protein
MLSSTVVCLLLLEARCQTPTVRAVRPEEVRPVLRAIVEAAEENGRRRPPLTGDALLDLYVRRAARRCHDDRLPTKALAIGLGIALDDTAYLRSNPLTRPFLENFETETDRKRRLAIIGSPTLRGRHDWALHFAVSAMLAAATDAESAERIGLLKEMDDAWRGSGFSFADLAADYAGVFFAEDLRTAKEPALHLKALAEGFRGNALLPPIDDLPEGLRFADLNARYGGVSSDRFRDAVAGIRARIAEQRKK